MLFKFMLRKFFFFPKVDDRMINLLIRETAEARSKWKRIWDIEMEMMIEKVYMLEDLQELHRIKREFGTVWSCTLII